MPLPPELPSDVRLPALSGDCLTYMSGEGDVRPFDWATLVLRAGNCSSDDSVCMLVQNDVGDTPRVVWMFDVPVEQIGSAMDVAEPPSGMKLLLTIHNTTYGLLGDHEGQIGGVLTVEAFDPGAGKARIQFDGVTMTGADAVYSFPARCAIDGAMEITRFETTALGERCQTDHECGGDYSGRVCDDHTFVCAAGCHVEDDCPLGSLCDTTTGSCEVSAGASADEIAICEDACHDMYFFDCITDEAACKDLCATEPRASVKAFAECAEGVLECTEGSECVALL